MPQKISPNRRRSIAVLNQGGGPTRASYRRRAYSIVPGEKLSPAARARNLAPRKSILKGSVGLRNGSSRLSQEHSATVTEGTDMTQSMDLTEIHAYASRKSLGRRVSFASHAHVRLFEVQDPNNSGSADHSPSPAAHENVEDSDDNDENGRTSQEAVQARNRRRSSQRRRSSTAFSQFGEQSMDMDEGDSALDPQDFFNGDNCNVEAFDEDDEDEEDDYGEDMDMTEAIPREFIRKRSLSLGGPSQSFAPRRRSSVAPLATSSSSHSENQIPHRSDPQAGEQTPPAQTQESIYPSLQLEDILNLPPDEQDHPHDPEHPNEDVTSSTMQFGTEGEDMTESSGGDNTQPMEFTIPVVRPPPPPTKEWLQLRAMTHAGSEPYEPPPDEASDDPEANAIVHLDQDGDEAPMDLTDALNRLQKARSSLVLPSAWDSEGTEGHHPPQGVRIEGFQDDTFTSTEDSFDDGFDGDRTINITKLRQSLGAASMRDQSMDVTSMYGGSVSEELGRESALTSQESRSTSGPHVADTSSTTSGPSMSTEVLNSDLPPPVFSLPRPGRSSVFSLPTTTVEGIRPPVFSLPSTLPTLNAFSAPTRTSETQNPPKSPARAVPTVPKPFTFSLDARLGTPAKSSGSDNVSTPASSSRIPVFRGTAAFAPPTAPKSPRKRPAPMGEDPREDRDLPSPAKKQAVGKLSPSKKAVFEHPAAQAPTNRRTSTVRRPSGYFAQRKSLGGSALTATSSLPTLGGSGSPERNLPPVGLRQRASMGAIPAEGSIPLYPDLSHIDEPATGTPRLPAELYPDVSSIVQHPPVPASPATTQDPAAVSPGPAIQMSMASGKDQADAERETSVQGIAIASPTAGLRSLATVHEPERAVSPLIPSEGTLPPSAPPMAAPLQEQGKEAPPAPLNERASSVQALPQIPPLTSYVIPEEPSEDEDDMELTEQWRDGLDDAEGAYEGDDPTISVEQFFQMTGIRFMDELTAPRRSTIHPGQLRQNRRRSLTSSHSEEAEPVPLAEFMSAMAVEVPQLELYSVLADELNAWIEESKKICRQAEEDAIQVTPALFREFAEADESEKADLVHQLKLIKAHNIGMAKSQWYDWKSQWVGQLQNSAAEAFTNLESDAKVLEGIINQAQAMVPALRAEYEQAARELEEEEADIAELQNSDKDYLNELKTSIAEQDVELQAFKANVSEAETKLKRLSEKLSEIEAQKQENATAIARAEHIVHIQTESTGSEVFRLQDELEALQDLHLWRTTKMEPSLVEFIYASRFVVSIPCVKFTPVLAQLTISRAKGVRLAQRDPFPQLTQLMLDGGRHTALTTSGEINIRKVLQRLGDFWSSCAQIQSQLTFLSIKYPLSTKALPVDQPTPSFQATATVLFPVVKSKAYVTFTFDAPTYSRWPLSIASLKLDVEVAYGRIERQRILDAVLARLSQATPSENHGCLLDACIEATEEFAQA